MTGTLVVVAALAILVVPILPRGESHAVSFHRDIQPIFDQSCVSCHPAAYPYLDLRPGHAYKQLVGVSPPNAPSYERVVPGRPKLSYLLIHPPDPSRLNLLSQSAGQLIARWILQGAKNN
ncbi:MAG: hypothetical protein ABJB93_09400 [Gaiellales bacterium]